MGILRFGVLTVFISCFSIIPSHGQDAMQEARKNAALLLEKMELEEKIAQLILPSHPVLEHYVNESGQVDHDSLKKYFPYGVGGFNLNRNFDPGIYATAVNSIQDYCLKTRLGIPVLFVGEGLHGFMSKDATVFPQAIALGCTWDMDLLERLYDATASEASARGVKLLLSPVLDIGRDPRFGRIEEMYSEDPYLTAQCGKAAVKGFQGNNVRPDSNHVGAALKHFLGHGIPEGGRNVAPINISQYDLMNDHLLPFEICIKEAGALGVMPSYNEFNGLPNHANTWLLKNVLRDKLQFKGLLVADQNAIDELYRTHAVAGSPAEAAQIAINNGIALDIRYRNGTYDYLAELVEHGLLEEKIIDDAVLQVLTIKYHLGLFERPHASIARTKQITNCAAHKKIALEAAEKSMVLLKNEGNLLPLSNSKIKKIAVIGPNASGVHFGGYTVEPISGIDVLEGITAFPAGNFEVMYAEGCKIAQEEGSFWMDNVHTPNSKEADEKLIREAVEVAGQCDVVILAIGENVSFSREAWGENHLGDRDNLDLLGRQDQLAEALIKTNKPIVALIFGGRPLSFNYVAENVPAIIQCFYLGQEGGTAIANVLFGKTNPSGKLATTIPKSVGQLPCYYSRKPSRMRSYIYYPGSEPLYPFGYGLSYSSYVYSNLRIDHDTIRSDEKILLEIDVKNTGKIAGEEIVQLYIEDQVSVGVRPVMELKGFNRVPLNAGETKTISFIIDYSILAYYNPMLEKSLEPGIFTAMVGPNSSELLKITFVVK